MSPATPLLWRATLRNSWERRKRAARTRSRTLICLTFSHKPIIWRCWCVSDGAHEAAFPLPRRPFRGRNSPLDRAEEFCHAEPVILYSRGSRAAAYWVHLAPPKLDSPCRTVRRGRMVVAGACRVESGTRVRLSKSCQHIDRI